MLRMLSKTSTLAALVTLALPPQLPAQTGIGTVDAATATVSGALTLSNGRAALGPNAVLTAHDRTATLTLARGGEILVCATSALHAARGAGDTAAAPLLLALDRGAVEIRMVTTSRDAILTPDLRLSVAPPAPGQPVAAPLDLRIRVAANGDTCVENRGTGAPTLEIAEQFGSGVYQVRPGQHVLFEHASLREVVDHESSPCGCPPAPALSVATGGIATDPAHAARPGSAGAAAPAEANPAATAATQHPFPAAESQGLTPPHEPAATVPQAPPGQPHAQIAATMAFDGTGTNSDAAAPLPSDAVASAPANVPTAGPPSQPGSASPAAPPVPARELAPPTSNTPPSAPPAPPAAKPAATAQAPPPPPAPPARDLVHSLGRFFRRLFSR